MGWEIKGLISGRAVVVCRLQVPLADSNGSTNNGVISSGVWAESSVEKLSWLSRSSYLDQESQARLPLMKLQRGCSWCRTNNSES